MKNKNIITYTSELQVQLDGKKVGTIRPVYDVWKTPRHMSPIGATIGYQYFPNGQKIGGDVYPLFMDCLQSLE